MKIKISNTHHLAFALDMTLIVGKVVLKIRLEELQGTRNGRKLDKSIPTVALTQVVVLKEQTQSSDHRVKLSKNQLMT